MVADVMHHQRVGAGAAVDRDFRCPNKSTESLPAPALMMSAPPPPWMMSSPDPVVMMLAEDEPVTVSAVVIALALRFSKFMTLTESPAVWSTPAATAKLTAVTLAPAMSTNVSEPDRHRSTSPSRDR